MINHLRHMAVFARVVDEGSFRAAAKELGLAPSRVSETVSDLETYLGVTLLNRTTRKLFLTTEGRKFHAHAVELVQHAEAGLNELNALSLKPIGELKISMPAFLATSGISSAVADFARLHPDVSLSINYTDQVVDILNEGLDLSVRAGWLKDSSMMSRKLGEGRRLLVASKDYVAGRSTAKHPSELSSWDWIHFSMRSNSVKLDAKTGESASVMYHSRINVNSTEAVWHMANLGHGLAILPEHLVAQHVQSGDLVHILPEWELPALGYYAVWPDKSRRENLTLLLVRFLAEHGQLSN